MRRLIAFALALTLVGSLSCGRTVTGPDKAPVEDNRIEENIQFALVASAASGSPAEPVTITATIQNVGPENIDIPNRCPEPTIRLYDLYGRELLLRDPMELEVCPAWASRPFRPGERWDIPLTFDGVYYASNGRRLSAPAGTYRAVATFAYIAPGMPILARDVTFDWR